MIISPIFIFIETNDDESSASSSSSSSSDEDDPSSSSNTFDEPDKTKEQSDENGM